MINMSSSIYLDFDGTIANTNQVKYRAFYDALASHCPDIDMYSFFDMLNSLYGKKNRYEILGFFIDHYHLETTLDDLTNLYESLFCSKLSEAQLASGIRLFFSELKSDFHFYIVSAGKKSEIISYLDAHRLTSYFTNIYEFITDKASFLNSHRTCSSSDYMIGDSYADASVSSHSIRFIYYTEFVSCIDPLCVEKSFAVSPSYSHILKSINGI